MAADYDINGVNAGIDAGQLFNNLENTFIANRKEIFAGAMKAEDWRGEVLNRFRAYNEANSVAALNALSEARRLTEEQIGISFNSGVELAQRHLQAVKKPKENEAKEFLQTVLNGAVSGAMAGLISTSVYALQQAQNQYLNIAYTVNPGAEDMGREIDRAQAVWLKRGIPGAKTAAGDKEMSAQAEFILRDNSHSALVQAEGRTAALAGVALVLISSHPSSCPLCLPWQNKVVIDDVNNDGKPDGKHELLSNAVSEGFWHYNCRHEVIPYIEGVTNPEYYKRNTATPRETAMRYAVEQEQRYNERNIREWKRVEAGAVDETLRRNAGARVEEWQARQRNLAKVAKAEGIPYYRQYAREQPGGETKPTLKLNEGTYSGLTTTKSDGTINPTIETRSHTKGKPTAIIGGQDLNKKQRKIDKQLKRYDSKATFRKRDVSMKDLSALTAMNSVEYSMFTKGGERLIIRGNDWKVGITIETAREMAKEGWTWSGHTHLGTDLAYLTPSKGDLNILEAFGQDKSVIYNQAGEHQVIKRRKE